MLEYLAHVDTVLMHFINVSLSNPVTTFIMPIITDDSFLRVLYAASMVIILWKGDRRLRWMVLFSGIALALTDQIASNWLKHWFERPRPCATLTDILVLVNCGSGYSMPSSHAANSFAQAVLFSVHYKSWRPYLLTFASLIAISRVFVGVHYPFDVLVGAAIGSIIGFGVAVIYERIWFRKGEVPLEATGKQAS
jgi:membrane-associated phospholipid phosphatase